MANRKGSVYYKLREGGGVEKSLILKLGVDERLGSWGLKKLTPPHQNFSQPPLECILWRGERALSVTNLGSEEGLTKH